MTRSRYRFFETEYPYFLTNTAVAWLPVFAYPRFVEIIFDSWRFLQRERGIRILGYADPSDKSRNERGRVSVFGISRNNGDRGC